MSAIRGLCHSRVPSRNSRLVSAGARSMEKTSAPRRANATALAIGLNRRPSTLCRVKVGRYAL